MAQFATDANADHTGPDVEEDVGQEEEEPSGGSALPSQLRVPPNTERKCIVNPIFAGAGSRMNRSWPSITAEHRASLASSATDMSSGEELEGAWHEGDIGRQPTRANGKRAHAGEGVTPGAAAPAPTPDGTVRRLDWRAAGGGAVPTTYPSSWAGYGGAAAWVRSSSRDATPMSKGSKNGGRRGPPRF